MADSRDLFVVSDQDAPVLAAAQTFLGAASARDDEDVWFVAEGDRVVDVWKGAADFQHTDPVRWVNIWDATDSVDAAIDFAAALRAKGFVVILDPNDPDLLAAAAAAHVAAA